MCYVEQKSVKCLMLRQAYAMIIGVDDDTDKDKACRRAVVKRRMVAAATGVMVIGVVALGILGGASVLSHHWFASGVGGLDAVMQPFWVIFE